MSILNDKRNKPMKKGPDWARIQETLYANGKSLINTPTQASANPVGGRTPLQVPPSSINPQNISAPNNQNQAPGKNRARRQKKSEGLAAANLYPTRNNDGVITDQAAPNAPPKPKNQIDVSFVRKNEGDEVKAYALTDKKGNPIGNSGATMGTGIDVGQMNAFDLNILKKHYKLSEGLYTKLSPYLGKTKEAAIAYLKNNPLTLSKEEARNLSDAKYGKIERDLIHNYNIAMKGNNSPKRFTDLNPHVQTVLMDLATQYGPALYNSAPKFWGQALSGNLEGMITEVGKFKGPTKRPEARKTRLEKARATPH